MKELSRILTIILCFTPFAFANAGPVATTSGSNLTAFNPSNANNNQWATMTNGRYDGNVTARADFGNCNALIMRCATPKCSNGGCADASIASAIVAGCVQSNNSCKQYGDDLVSYMTAQLVASSNAKINEQQMAAEVARAQAEAAASASNEQISQMQNQMYQMQQQMAQQQAQSAAQLQEALAAQAEQSAAALAEMKSAATASAMETESGISAYQQEAIDRGISTDVLERQKITGQIMTEIENAEVSLTTLKDSMDTAFDYARCDKRGNNCRAPKRVKKWRELASDFLEPYDNTVDKIYDALVIAQTVGVDLSQIYMMLNNSCNSWGQYMCEKGGDIQYVGEKGTPMSCPEHSGKTISDCLSTCKSHTEVLATKVVKPDGTVQDSTSTETVYDDINCEKNCRTRNCKPCTLLKVLTDQSDVYEGWINPSVTGDDNGTVVACASGALDSSKLFTRRTKNKNGAGLVDIDQLDIWINQVEPDKDLDGHKPFEYCGTDSAAVLERSVLSKVVPAKGAKFCVDRIGVNAGEDKEQCPYIHPIYGICDTALYNIGLKAEDVEETTDSTAQSSSKSGGIQTLFTKVSEETSADGKKVEYYTMSAEQKDKIQKILGLKITAISQQMYKQYEYLNATIRRLKIQLEKATLTAALEAAGAKNESGSSSGLLGSNSNDDKTIHLAGAENCANKMSSESLYSCVQTNVSLIISSATSNTKKACKQLQETISAAKTWGIDVSEEESCKNINASCNKKDIVPCAQKLNVKIAQEKEKKSQQQSFRGLMGYGG